jgi:hypothetical protein
MKSQYFTPVRNNFRIDQDSGQAVFIPSEAQRKESEVKSLGHQSLAATQIYSQLNLDPVRESVNAATRAIIKAGRKRLTA